MGKESKGQNLLTAREIPRGGREDEKEKRRAIGY